MRTVTFRCTCLCDFVNADLGGGTYARNLWKFWVPVSPSAKQELQITAQASIVEANTRKERRNILLSNMNIFSLLYDDIALHCKSALECFKEWVHFQVNPMGLVPLVSSS